MNVLLDTCAVIALGLDGLPPRAAAALAKAPSAFVAVVSPWEVAIKAAAGRLELPGPADVWFAELRERHDLDEIVVDTALACAAAALPPLHRDPFDRVIVALALARRATVLTSDERIAAYPGVKTLW